MYQKSGLVLGGILGVALCSACDMPSTPSSKPVHYQDVSLGGASVLAVTNLSLNAAELSFSIPPAKTSMNRLSSGALSGDIPRPDREFVSRINANPPPYPKKSLSRSAAPVQRAAYAPGESRQFWVQDNNGSFSQINAVLRKQGAFSNVWVHDARYDTASLSDKDNRINDNQVKELADKFDLIYPLAANLLGYEYGGGPGGDGGIDGDPRIQILVYDIDGDYAPGQSGGTIGYFFSLDEYPQTYLNGMGRNYKSNEAEMFYIDACFLDSKREMVYSTLIHEYQHMINFNRKFLKKNLSAGTWYDEMLSMLAEDVIAPGIGITSKFPGHPVWERIPLFLSTYYGSGVDLWEEGDKVYVSYSLVYAFGAYLVRNYGGPELIREMLDNDGVNHDCINAALVKVKNDPALSFESALERFAEALWYSRTKTGTIPDDKMSFDRNITANINGKLYTAEGFDIWGLNRAGAYAGDKGPDIPPLLRTSVIQRHSVQLYTILPGTNVLKAGITAPDASAVRLGILPVPPGMP